MKKIKLVIALLLSSVVFSCDGVPFESYDETGYEGVPLADPFILSADGIYYAYGTSGILGFKVFTSTDMVNWTQRLEPALIAENSYGEKGFWAPEVFFNKNTGRYIMYYTAERNICVAESDSPLGPFKQESKTSNYNLVWALDATIFQDSDEKYYLYYTTDNGENDEIWGAELSNNSENSSIRNRKKCIVSDQEWEKRDGLRIAEGAFVIKHKDYYYMIYSGSTYDSPNYSIGYAYAKNPLGPWTKYEKNPILHKPNYNGKVLEGTGHGMIFKDMHGGLKLVFHAHNLPGKVEPRNMYITSVHFTDDDIPVMYFGNDIIRALLVDTE